MGKLGIMFKTKFVAEAALTLSDQSPKHLKMIQGFDPKTTSAGAVTAKKSIEISQIN